VPDIGAKNPKKIPTLRLPVVGPCGIRHARHDQRGHQQPDRRSPFIHHRPAPFSRRRPPWLRGSSDSGIVSTSAQEKDVRAELNKARGVQIQTSKVLAVPPPQKPIPQPIPREPTGNWVNNRNNNNPNNTIECLAPVVGFVSD